MFYFSLPCEIDHCYPQFVVPTMWRLGRRGGASEVTRGLGRPSNRIQSVWTTQGPAHVPQAIRGRLTLNPFGCSVQYNHLNEINEYLI